MSGHSKWSQIKHQKLGKDLKRGQTFTKLANAITIAVHQGRDNPDPETNFKLRLVVEKAKAANMPKDNISKAIARAVKGEKKGSLEEVVYEGYGPCGVAIMIEATTDNRARTTSEIKNIFESAGGKLSSPGSVSFLFKQVGLINVKISKKNSDELMMTAIDCGATDLEKVGNYILVYTDKGNIRQVKKKLEEKGMEIESSEETTQPISAVSITDRQKAEKILSLMDNLENQQDVQKVHANFDIPEEFLSGVKQDQTE